MAFPKWVVVAAGAAYAQIVGDNPGNPLNNLGFEQPLPTPPPAPLIGQYCRGGACQYRVDPVPPTLPPTPNPPILYPNTMKDFCRGFTCHPLQGYPASPAADAFMLNCAHLFQDIAPGAGEFMRKRRRSMDDIKKWTMGWCSARVGATAHLDCPGFTDVVVMSLALSAAVDLTSIAGAPEICLNLMLFLGASKGAEVDLKLIVTALPKPAFLQQTEGPTSIRGKKWRDECLERGWIPAPGSAEEQKKLSMMATMAKEEKSEQPQISADVQKELDKPETKPIYGQVPWREFPDRTNFPDAHVRYFETKNPKLTGTEDGEAQVQHGDKKYFLAPGNPTFFVPPFEIGGRLFEHCQNQMSEIMAGFAQTGEQTITMTKGWCGWQASVRNFLKNAVGTGHPDWNYANCNGMSNLMAFALRYDLDKGLSAHNVCKRLFISMAQIHTVSNLVKDAWTVGVRSLTGIVTTTSVDDEEMKKRLDAALKYQDSLMGKLREQKDMYNELNTAKMDTKAFLNDPKPAPTPAPAPALPDEEDMEVALIQDDDSLHPFGVGVGHEKSL